MEATQGRLTAAQEIIGLAKFARIAQFHRSMMRKFFNRVERIRFPHSMLHLQPLNQELGLDHSADPGLKIKKVVSAPAVVRNSNEHIFDLPNEIGTLPRLRPNLPGQSDELETETAAQRPRASERLQFPELRA